MITSNNFIKQLKKKNPKALCYVIDTYGNLVKTVVHAHLYQFSPEEEECINDVFFAVWNHIDSYDDTKNTFKNWICAIAKHKSIDYLRKYQKHISEVSIEEEVLYSTTNVEEDALAFVLSEEIENMLSYLSDADRLLFLRRYIGEEDVASLAKDFQLKPGSIYARLKKAKTTIRKQVKGE